MGFIAKILASLAKVSGKTWAYMAAVAALTGLVWAGYHAIDGRGYSRCEREHQLALASHIERAQTQAAEIALQDAEISESYEIWRTRTVTKIEEVIREVPADCAACRLNPNGLSLLNAARGGGLPMAKSPDQPDAAVPAPGAAPNRDDAGTGRRSLDGRTPILRLQNAPELADSGRAREGI